MTTRAARDRDRARANMRLLRATRRQRGLCPRCGEQPANPRENCRTCRRVRALKQNGVSRLPSSDAAA